MGKPRQTFEFREVVYQSKLANILTIDCIVLSLKGNTMIPDMSVSVYGLVQFTITVIGIQLELVGLHGIVFLSFMPGLMGVGDTTVRWR